MKLSSHRLLLVPCGVICSAACLLALASAQVAFGDAAHPEEPLSTSQATSKSSAGDALELALTKPSTGKRELPSFQKVEQIVAGRFGKAELAGNTVITRSQVKPLFYALLKAGWRVKNAEEIYKLLPEDDDFIVQQLRSPKGAGFAKDVAELPGAWDTIDRLAELPHGRSTLKRLVKGPDGYKMIEYITTSRGGANLATMLSKAPKGKDFKKPTGKIYTVPMLMDRLKESYTAAKADEPKTAQLRPATRHLQP